MSTKDANDVKPTSSKSNEISLSGTATPKKTSSVPAKEDRKDTTKKDIANERTSSSKSKDDSEKYVELKNKLIQQILKKQELTRKLTTLEDSIYQKEIDYFEESPLGNIVKGFENFSKTGGGGGANKRKIVYSEDDHIFSLSSVNYIKSLMKRQGHTSNGGLQKTILMIMKILLIQPLLVQEVKLIVSRRTRRPVVVVAHLVEKERREYWRIRTS